jgi:hypothetical protein
LVVRAAGRPMSRTAFRAHACNGNRDSGRRRE